MNLSNGQVLYNTATTHRGTKHYMRVWWHYIVAQLALNYHRFCHMPFRNQIILFLFSDGKMPPIHTNDTFQGLQSRCNAHLSVRLGNYFTFVWNLHISLFSFLSLCQQDSVTRTNIFEKTGNATLETFYNNRRSELRRKLTTFIIHSHHHLLCYGMILKLVEI